MKIIIGAMEEELADLITDLKGEKVKSKLNEYYVAKHDLVIVTTGIGLVNAAMGLSYLLTKYQDQKIDYVLNIGTAAAIDPKYVQNDVILIQQATYWFANATGFGYELGQIPQMPVSYQSNQKLVKIIHPKLEEFNLKLGNLSSSDMFITKLHQINEIRTNLPIPIEIVDMEGTAFFQVAYLFKIPFLAIKIVSDVLEHPDSSEKQFDEFLMIASQKISQIIQKIM